MAVEAIELRAPQAALHLVTPDSNTVPPPPIEVAPFVIRRRSDKALVFSTEGPDEEGNIPNPSSVPLAEASAIIKAHQTVVFESLKLNGGQDYSLLLKPAEAYIEPPISDINAPPFIH